MKIIKVSCKLPAGVVVDNFESRAVRRKFAMAYGRKGVWELFDATMDAAFGRKVETSTTVSSTEPILLTLEVPADETQNVAKALRSMVQDLES
jgi:hypothetical protein